MPKKSAPLTPEELRAKKERKRARLQALLPLLSPGKAQDAREELSLLDARLGKQQPAFAKKPKDDPASASGVNGVGGLVFQAKSPPGAGRLLRVPFVLYEANAAQLSFQPPSPTGTMPRLSRDGPTLRHYAWPVARGMLYPPKC